MFFGTIELCLDSDRKIGPICLVLVDLTAGWRADKIGMSCKNFKILYKLNYLDSYFIIKKIKNLKRKYGSQQKGRKRE